MRLRAQSKSSAEHNWSATRSMCEMSANRIGMRASSRRNQDPWLGRRTYREPSSNQNRHLITALCSDNLDQPLLNLQNNRLVLGKPTIRQGVGEGNLLTAIVDEI